MQPPIRLCLLGKLGQQAFDLALGRRLLEPLASVRSLQTRHDTVQVVLNILLGKM